MRSYWWAFVLVLFVPQLAGAQVGVQDGVKVGKVFVTGENPGIRLMDKQDGQVLTGVSYWRIVRSPVGPAHRYVTSDGKSPSDLRIALTDNRKLYDYSCRIL